MSRDDDIQNIILMCYGSAGRNLPDVAGLKILVGIWAGTLRRIDSADLVPAYEYARDNHDGYGMVTADIIGRSYPDFKRSQRPVIVRSQEATQEESEAVFMKIHFDENVELARRLHDIANRDEIEVFGKQWEDDYSYIVRVGPHSVRVVGGFAPIGGWETFDALERPDCATPSCVFPTFDYYLIGGAWHCARCANEFLAQKDA